MQRPEITRLGLGAVLALSLVATAAEPAAAAGTCRGLAPTIVETTGTDTLTGTPGPDVIISKFGDDTIVAGGGDDLICIGTRTNRNVTTDGGAGFDTVVMEFPMEQFVGIDLPAGTWQLSGTNPGNTRGGLTSIEGVIAHYAGIVDLPGSNRYELTSGSVVSAGGNDVYRRRTAPAGTPAALSVSYARATSGMAVDLVADTATGWTTDVLTGVTDVVGTGFADSFVGDDSANSFDGAYGADVVNGGGGDDRLAALGASATIDGGPGNDTVTPGGRWAKRVSGGTGTDIVYLLQLNAAVTVDLRTQMFVSGGVARAFSSFEGVLGTRFDDVLTGTNGPNVMFGRQGTDRLNGLGGDDDLWGEFDNDILDAGTGNDTCHYIGGPQFVNMISCETQLEWGD